MQFPGARDASASICCKATLNESQIQSLAMLESVGPLGYVIRKLNQVFESGNTSQSRLEVIEIIEALILALVAVATAWSGYQAAKWAGNRAEQYAKANRLRVTAEGLATLAGQERIYDSDTFNSWLAARLDGKAQAAEFFERRFRDVHTLTQHAFTSINRYESVGKLLFGQPGDWPFLEL